MRPARVVFPGFWFGKSNLKEAENLARRGVGGFCVYGGTAEQTLDFTKRMQDISPYDQLLFCADITVFGVFLGPQIIAATYVYRNTLARFYLKNVWCLRKRLFKSKCKVGFIDCLWKTVFLIVAGIPVAVYKTGIEFGNEESEF